MIITPKDIERAIQKDSKVQEIIEKINKILSTEAKIREAICGQVSIDIREPLRIYVINSIIYLYKKAGWSKVEFHTFTYDSVYSLTKTFPSEGIKFTFYM